jgi:uncharacterized membrane protein YphA (DoxX/SURF4 family)
VKPWVVYTAIRISIFVATLLILFALGVTPWIAAVVAAVVGLCSAYIFFRPQRDQLIARVKEQQQARVDEKAEDQADDPAEN